MVSSLDDRKIIELFFERSEQAIIELSKKYGSVCSKVAFNILNNTQDTEECVNDAYLGTWNTIPPQNPNPLLSYVCRIVRNLAIKKYHANTAAKRNSFYDVALDELENCFPSSVSVEDEFNAIEPHDSLMSFSKPSIRKTELCLFAAIGMQTPLIILPNSFIQATTTSRFGFIVQEKS